jgi:hypothetical protein
MPGAFEDCLRKPRCHSDVGEKAKSKQINVKWMSSEPRVVAQQRHVS